MGEQQHNRFTNRHLALFAACLAISLPGALVIAPTSAQAQFICVGNATGAAVPPGTADGGGATTFFDGMACGKNADASGSFGTAVGDGNPRAQGVSDTAVGYNAGPTGTGGNNTSIGSAAGIDFGGGQQNTAVGSNADGASGVSNSVVIGFLSQVGADNTVAIGSTNGTTVFGARAQGANSVAIGAGADTAIQLGGGPVGDGTNATALGAGASAVWSNTTAIGQDARAGGGLIDATTFAVTNGDTAAGQGSRAFGTNSSAFGKGTVAGGIVDGSGFITTFNENSTAIGSLAQAGATGIGQSNATAVGAGTLANARVASAFGALANAGGTFGNEGTTAIGVNALAGTTAAGQTYATALGANAAAQGANAIAIGGNSTTGAGGAAFASATNAIALGNGAQATNTNAIAQGFGAAATGANAIAIGTGAVATGSIAMGNTASASNGGSAFGDFANATCPTCVANVSSATALGNSASATTANAVAVGQSAVVLASNGTVIGAGAVVQAGATNAVAIGHGSVATAPNTVSFGSPGNERRLTNIAPGIAPTDAATVGQISSITSGIQSQIGSIQNEVAVNQTEARAGVALALAAGSLQYDTRPGKLSVAAAYGNFKGESGLASGLGYALTDQWRLSASFSATPEVENYGFTVGSSWTLN